MTVKITKPALNLREELADLRKPSGIAGEALLRADSVQEQRDLIGAGRKNLIINGDFQVSQRGDFTTASAAVDGTYYLDRWTVVFDTIGVTKQDTGNAMKVVATSSGTGSLRIRHKFEDTTYLGGKTVTISCQMKSNSPNARINVYADGWQSATSNYTGGGAWESVSLTLTIPTGVSSELSAHFGIDGVSSANVSVTSGDYCEIKECQLELGSVATEFEHRSYGEELALCQRYYQKSYDRNTYAGSTSSDGAVDFYGSADGTNILAKISYPVQLRTNTPTITIYNPNNSGNSGTVYILSGSGAAHYTPTVNNIATSGFRCYAPRIGSAWTGHRMIFHWTADGEL